MQLSMADAALIAATRPTEKVRAILAASGAQQKAICAAFDALAALLSHYRAGT